MQFKLFKIFLIVLLVFGATFFFSVFVKKTFAQTTEENFLRAKVIIERLPLEIALGESFTVTAWIKNVGENYKVPPERISVAGTLFISFPSLTQYDYENQALIGILIDKERGSCGWGGIEKAGDWTNSKDDKMVRVEYLGIDALKDVTAIGKEWREDEGCYYKVKITPKSLGAFKIYVRGAFYLGENRFPTSIDPASGELSDYRGWPVYSKEIMVKEKYEEGIAPPLRLNNQPSGQLPAGTIQTVLSLATDKNAACKYVSSPEISYSSMTNFSNTGGTYHATLVTNLLDGKSYDYFIKCKGNIGNANLDDYTISFSVAFPSIDVILPIISISSLSDGEIYYNTLPYAMVSGKVSDNISVDKAEIRINSGEWQLLSVTENGFWSQQVTLNPGLNTIEIRAVDSSGNIGTKSITITYVPSGIISVRTNITEASYTITGPKTYSGSGTWWSAPSKPWAPAPYGEYTITYKEVSGYKTPKSQIKILNALSYGSIMFTEEYIKEIPETGSISATSYPSGAKVYLDGIYKGITPLTITEVSTGSYTVKFKKTNYEDCSKAVAVTSGTVRNVSCVPIYQTGLISVSTTPVQGKIYVNGIDRGKGSYTGLYDIGEYKVSFGDVEGYRTPSSQTFALSPEGKSITGQYTVGSYNPSPRIETGRITVITLPDATFTITGTEPETYAGSGPSWTKSDVPIGDYAIIWNPVSGYKTPSSVTKTLAPDKLIRFDSAYLPVQQKAGKPVIVFPLIITPIKDKYDAGDTLTAKFTVKNTGEAAITFDKLTVGGRLNDKCPNNKCPDFTFRSLTLEPNQTYTYKGILKLTQPGNYHFFIAYYIENPISEEKKLLDPNNWNTSIDLGKGLTDKDRRKGIIVIKKEETPSESQLPTCDIELQKDGVGIDEIDVNESFDIHFSDYSGNIKKVHFLSDESQNGQVDKGFTWTDWYEWNKSLQDWTGFWDHTKKIKTWTFTTPGSKEVWAEVKDDGQTSQCSAIISTVLPPPEWREITPFPSGAYISRITPDSGVAGEKVTITGINFNKILKKVTSVIFKEPKMFGDVEGAEIIYPTSDTQIVFIVPVMRPLRESNRVEVALGGWRDNLVSNRVEFTYKKPVLKNLDPPFGDLDLDTEITLSGNNFGYKQIELESIGIMIIPEHKRIPPPSSYVTFGATRIDEVISWTNGKIIIKPPSDYGVGLGYAKDTFNALTYFMVLGEKSGEYMFKALFKKSVEELIDQYFPELKPKLQLKEDEPLWSQWLKIVGAIGVEAVPGLSIVVDVNLVPTFALPVIVTTTGGTSEVLLFRFKVKKPSQIFIEDSLIAHLASPAELRIYDSQGRVTGLVNGEIKEEIPNSMYDAGNKAVIIFDPSNFDSYRYGVVGTDTGTYGLTITSVENEEVTAFTATDVPTLPEQEHQYTIDWDKLSRDEEGATTLKIDANGDGKPEQIIIADSTLQLLATDEKSDQLALGEKVLGDINKDGRIDIFDSNFLIINWGESPENKNADFDEDGKVDISDFNTLMVNWTG